jgi:hypothetical protein
MKRFVDKNYFYPVLLIIAVILAYFPILSNDFLYHWDDQWVVMNHYTESGFTGENLWAILTEFYHGQYAPFNELLYLSLYSLFGYDPFPFHLASLLLHIACACLIYCTFKLLLEINTKKTKHPQIIAFLTALIFALHPFNTESVAWMSASKVLVYAFFYWAATYYFLLYLKRGKTSCYIYTLLLFICSFLGKEQAVTFPLWMLLLYWMRGQSIQNRKIVLTTLPFFVLSLFFGIVTMLSQSGGTTIISQDDTYPVWQRLVYACYTFSEYLFKTVLPYKLSYLYPFPSLVGEPLPDWLLIYPLLITLLLVSFGKALLSKRVLSFGLVFFLIHIAVALHLISLSRFAVVADRYAYVATAGVAFMLSFYAVRLFEKRKQYRKIVVILLTGYVLYLGIYANRRSYVWYNTDTLKKEIRELLKDRNEYEEKKSPSGKEAFYYLLRHQHRRCSARGREDIIIAAKKITENNLLNI